MKLLIISILLTSWSLTNYAQSVVKNDHSGGMKSSVIKTSGNDRSSTLYFGEPEVIASGQGWVTIVCNPPFTFICVWIHDERDNNGNTHKTIIINDGNYTEYEVLSDLEIEHYGSGTKITFKNK
jgi:hypothetical protein